MITGFHGGHWPLWHLLRAAVHSSEHAAIILQTLAAHLGEEVIPRAEAPLRRAILRRARLLGIVLAASCAACLLTPYGTRGIALRSGSADELAAVFASVLKGEPYIVPALQPALVGAVKLRPLDERTTELLSTREREVLACLAHGRSNREIAEALSVTLATVKSHLVHIYAKLGATNRNECLGRAVSLGLLR